VFEEIYFFKKNSLIGLFFFKLKKKDGEGHVKIADFGFAKKITDKFFF
jgi:hypothetical protein